MNVSTSKELEDLKIEVALLKDENIRLRAQGAKTGSTNTAHRSRGVILRISSAILVTLSVVLLSVANVIFWTGNTVVKQDRFVAATQPIIKDPKVQNSVALYATNSIFNNIDVQKVTEQALPPRADFLAPQLTNQLKSFTQTTLQKTFAKQSFQDKWNEALSKQHQRLISFASKYEGDGNISLNDVYKNLAAGLTGTKLAFLSEKQLPDKVGNIDIINASWLPAFHNVVTNIDTWRLVSVISLVATISLGVWMSQHRRRTLYIFCIASALAMIATLVALQIAKSVVVSKADPQYTDGVSSALQIVLNSFVAQTSTIFAAVLFVLGAAWVSGPSPRASIISQRFSLAGDKLHHQIFVRDNKYTSWFVANRRLLEWLVVAVAATIMLFLIRLTLLGLIINIVLILTLVFAIEVIGGQGALGGPKRHRL